MKKTALTGVVVLFISMFLLTNVWADTPIPAKKVFVGKNATFQRYIDFKFTIPAGNCGNLDVYEMILSYYPFTDPARWEKKSPGEIANKGDYRFVNRESSCSSEFELHGFLDAQALYERLWILELNPVEVGLLVKDNWHENNFYKLSEDDHLYSYYRAIPGAGVSMTLLAVSQAVSNMQISGKLVGAIVSNDGSGYLNEVVNLKLAKRNIPNWNRMIQEGDIVILIYKE